MSANGERLRPAPGRLRLFALLIVAAFVALSLQAWRMQVVQGRVYREQADYNRVRVSAIPPMRGLIYDASGSVVAANVPSFLVSVVLFSLGGVYAVYEGIHKIMNPARLDNPLVAIVVLLISVALEGYALRTAMITARAQARGVRPHPGSAGAGVTSAVREPSPGAGSGSSPRRSA